MEELYNLNINDNMISTMLEINPNLKDLSNKEILEKIEILRNIGCNEYQIINIISSNSLYLSRSNKDIISLLEKLYNLGFSTLNILFDSNPYILNLDDYEIDNYINERKNNGEKIDDIIDDMDTNTYLFNEI